MKNYVIIYFNKLWNKEKYIFFFLTIITTRYAWINEEEEGKEEKKGGGGELLHKNISNVYEQLYNIYIIGEDCYSQ